MLFDNLTEHRFLNGILSINVKKVPYIFFKNDRNSSILVIFDLKNEQNNSILAIFHLKNDQNSSILVIFGMKNGQNTSILVIFDLKMTKILIFWPFLT